MNVDFWFKVEKTFKSIDNNCLCIILTTVQDRYADYRTSAIPAEKQKRLQNNFARPPVHILLS